MYAPSSQHQLPFALTHSTPFSPAAWPGFYLSLWELITVSCVLI